MPHRIRPLLVPLTFLACILISTTLAAELRVGRAKVVITPPVGSVIGNSYGITVSTGVLSEVHAKAVVFELEGAKAALVACDLISLHPPIVKAARAEIAARTGLRPEHVIMAATHCHTGPQTHPLFYNLAPPAAAKLSEDYVAKLPGLIAESVRLAEADLKPAKIFVGRGREDTISFNRRFLLKDGTVKMNPGRLNPANVRPMGPIDPEVGVVYVESADGAPLVTIVNFALHVAIMGGSRVSADYPHALSQVLARVKGDAMLTLFINGMSGNINHTDFYRAKQLSGEPEAARVGSILAAAVLKTYRDLQPLTPTTLRAVSRPVPVPARPRPTAAELESARATVRGHGKGAPFPEVVRAWRLIDLVEYSPDGTWPSEVQALAFGRELALVGYPGDSFVEMGLSIKQNSPFAFTFVSEQSGNGSLGYIPNAKAFPEGSYEVESSRLDAGGGEVLATAATQLLTELFPRP
jgi:hypothetical protein